MVTFLRERQVKVYSKYEDVLEVLRHHVNRLCRMGNLVLEGERELCVRFGTSRKTLAKAMDTLVAEKVLYRESDLERMLDDAYRPAFREME